MEPILIEKIEAYLNGEIERQQLDTFAEAYTIDSLQKEIEWVKNAQLAIAAEGLSTQLHQLISISSTPENVIDLPNKPFRSKIIGWSLAASILILFGFLFVLKPTRTQRLYSKYEFVDPGIPLLMSTTNKYDLYDALSYYSEQNYEKTILRLTDLKLKNSGIYNDTIEFYLGVAQLYHKDITESLPSLLAVSKDDTSIFKLRAEWLYVLAFLKSGDISKSKLLLQPIVQNTDHPFFEQATALLSELEN